MSGGQSLVGRQHASGLGFRVFTLNRAVCGPTNQRRKSGDAESSARAVEVPRQAAAVGMSMRCTRLHVWWKGKASRNSVQPCRCIQTPGSLACSPAGGYLTRKPVHVRYNYVRSLLCWVLACRVFLDQPQGCVSDGHYQEARPKEGICVRAHMVRRLSLPGI